MFGLYLNPSVNTTRALEGSGPKLEDQVHQFTVFSVHTRAPYVRTCRTAFRTEVKGVRGGLGWRNFFNDLGKHYAAEYSGSFTIGVCWQKCV